ncbi:hypothetical protein [Hansschlegelia plantiphila]|uniref:Uncharacterized protein n=1 Tax=Hansschlegelia plantiphila TaxID=374655 RepID=A0A9W6MUY7_9HYPH|nr:hypothetical protein [Hansschlegelia plantiphila]GLK67195.1 hypothetical protein GCM10008179_08330 [Hansschlegelia plantiphila]
MLGLIDVRGRWRRALLAWADGRADRTTLVDWVQGPSFYADLRSPAARPDFTGVAGLTDLTPAQVEWLGGQEGFAGRLGFDGAFFEWGRALDYQPPGPFLDAGSLRMEGV